MFSHFDTSVMGSGNKVESSKYQAKSLIDKSGND